MTEERNPKTNRELPPLCAAVRRIRATSRWSQESMSRSTGIAAQTISRFERGVQVPRDYDVLVKLRDAAADAGLDDDEKLFQDLIAKHPRRPPSNEGPPPGIENQKYRPHEWRLMQAARIAVNFLPAVAVAIEKAAGPALAIVDTVIAETSAVDVSENVFFYDELETRLNAVAAQRVFQRFGMKGDWPK